VTAALFSALALVVAITIALFSYEAVTAQSPLPAPLPPSPHDAQMDVLEREALYESFRHQMAFIFTTWLKDPTGQPERAIRGSQQARRAFIAVADEITRRELIRDQMRKQ
jgi:hypothetical protein